MTQYRLLEVDTDTIMAADQYWDAATRKWVAVPYSFVGERFYTVIPYRRAIPDPEPVQQQTAIDPGEGWRLVKDDEIVLTTDERLFTNIPGGRWSLVTPQTVLRDELEKGSVTYAQIKERSSWKCVVFRRRATKKIVLKEYVVSYNEDYSLEWWVEKPEGGSVYATGQEREIEIPA